MLHKDYIPVLLSINSWEVYAPFTQGRLRPGTSLGNKDVNMHNDYEILVGLEGLYPYYYNGYCYDCKPGSIFLISPMLEHESYYTKAANSLTHMWLRVAEDSLLVTVSRINSGKIECIYRCKVSYQDYTPGLKFYKIWNSLLETEKITDQALLELKLALCHLFLAIIESDELTISKYRGEIMHRARNYIKNHFHQKLDIDGLAKKMGYSKFHFTRLFKRYHAVTVQEYVDQQRLKEVKRLLAENLTQKEIAYKLGFASRSSFANWYAKYRNL